MNPVQFYWPDDANGNSFDSKTGIWDFCLLFGRVYRQGNTNILVTHESTDGPQSIFQHDILPDWEMDIIWIWILLLVMKNHYTCWETSLL